MSTKRNPANTVKKLFVLSNQISTQLDSLIKDVDEPTFLENLKDVQKEILLSKEKDKTLSKETKELVKIMFESNEKLQKAILLSVKNKLQEYKTLGLLDKYQVNKSTETKKKTEVEAKE